MLSKKLTKNEDEYSKNCLFKTINMNNLLCIHNCEYSRAHVIVVFQNNHNFRYKS